MTKLGVQCSNEKTHKGAHLASQYYTLYELKSFQLCKHVAFHMACCGRSFGLRGHRGQLLTLLPLHFLLGLPAASPLFSTAPWKGGSNKCYQPSWRQTAPFCLWLLLYHPAFMLQRKSASVETTMASQHTSPSPLLLTNTLHAAKSTYHGWGAYGCWSVRHVH